MTVPPLTKCDSFGVYRRTDAVEELLGTLCHLPFDEIVRRCTVTSRSDREYIPSECLVHFLRSTRRDNGDARFNRLFPLLLRRFASAFPRGEKNIGEGVHVDAHISDITEYARDRFLALVAKDRQGGDQLDFYEVHFDEAVALLRATARNRISRRAVREMPLDLDPETNEPSLIVEQAVGSMRPNPDAFLFDERFRSQVLAVIDVLPPEQKEVMTMLLNNFQIESNDETVPTISRILKCDPRTVQNRRVRAIQTIQKRLRLGEEE
jgi:hypothetical protein